MPATSRGESSRLTPAAVFAGPTGMAEDHEPIARPQPSLAFAPEVKGYQPTPSPDEVWNQVTVG